MPSRLSYQINLWLESPRLIHRLLFATAFILLLSVGFFSLFRSEQFSQSSFTRETKSTLSRKIQLKHNANSHLKEKIRASGFFDFSLLIQPNEIQYVFKEGHLVFWSDNHFFPEYNRVKSDFWEKYIEVKAGKFLLIRDTLKLRGESFEMINLLPLFFSYAIDNNYIHPGPNPLVFEDPTVEVNNYQIESDVAISGSQEQYLFSVRPPTDFKGRVKWINLVLITAGLMFLTFLTAAVWQWAYLSYQTISRAPKKRAVVAFLVENKADYILLIMLVYSLLVRIGLLVFQLPHSIFYIRFFNPKYYGWSVLVPSPGDLLLNYIFAVLYLLVVKHLFRKTRLFELLNKWDADKRAITHLFKAAFFLLSQLALYWLVLSVTITFSTLKFPLDLLKVPPMETSSILTALMIVFSGALFWGLARTAFECASKNFKYGLYYQYLPSLFLFLLLTGFLNWPLSLATALVHLIMFLIVYTLKLPANKHSFDYAALVFFSLCAMSCAAICTFSVSRLFPQTDLERKTNFISQQLVENNLLGENLLHDVSKQVIADPYIAGIFQNPMLQAKDMEEKVRRFYLGNYLNRYDIQVLAFDDLGFSLSEYDKRTLSEVRNDFPYKLYKTNFPDIYYYITQQNQLLKNYLSIVPIYQYGAKTGTILIDMQLKKFIPNSILPVLLIDKKGGNQSQTDTYSYAVFIRGEMTNSFGNYNFRKDLIFQLLGDSSNYNHNQDLKEGYFLVTDLGKGRQIIVQSRKQSSWETVCNFSVIFILLELAICFFFAGNLLIFNFDRFSHSLTFKIQLYSVLAFFIPVSLVSVGVLVAVITSYNKELQEHFRENAANITYALNEDLQKFYQREKDIDYLNESILRTARLYNTDINIYQNNGQLLLSSSPIIFRTGLLSNLISPYAYYAIRQAKNKVQLQEEIIGKLHYNHVYVQVRSSDTGDELGIISIPFFASGQELSDRVANTLAIILNIATLTFLVFLFFSFVASNFITYPLKLITHRIRKTTLESENSPLVWESKDELGLLIREYNLMLQKLDQNKKTLATSQKESAWREVAQQVAHEIKNPLTPIKLSLQHMRRVIGNHEPPDKNKMDQTFDMIIRQVETLDEIASSFSIYAKMPTFHLEEVDLSKIIGQVLEVYIPDKKAFIQFPDSKVENIVLADSKMLGRIIANLLLNAFQAIPSDKVPTIQLRVRSETRHSLITITDNGVGISEEVAEKIFEPHFSTKFAGSGIGLYIAKKGIDQMGGEIGFESKVGVGTTFWIRLKNRELELI